MAISAVGDYTLNVTFTKEVYKGSNWVSDGTTDVRSVSFHVVNVLSVATGNNIPIGLMIGIAAASLAAIIIITFVLVRKKRGF